MDGFLIISFGTTIKTARENTILKFEEIIKQKFFAKNVYTAFTSEKIIHILAKDNIHIYSVYEAFEKMLDDCIENVFILTTHLLNGEEYDKIVNISEKYKKFFKKINISEPLLSNYEDLEKCASILNDKYSLSEREALVLLGHGTKKDLNSKYFEIEEIFKQKYKKNVHMILLEDCFKKDIIFKKINKKKYDKVILLPFMFLCGKHIEKDILGEDENSFKNIFLNEGFLFECILQGLGEDENIQNLYISHLENILK